ncbi:hypothetical protein OEA41_003184 [Lepraria neglecta]|uniref:Alpha/beta-hydrolase n=1 Tax=Lepraria neglecta TaxID=209136 RepID=A0AAE0DJ38_9LECA|nr:hypothetical protein OEA41_003184 [Lepraria neglecta]
MGLSITILRLLTALLLLAGASLGQSPDERPSNPSNAQPFYLDLGAGACNYAVNGLLDVKFSFPASWAGQIPLPNTVNDEVFSGYSRRKPNLNSGPGCSSLDRLTKENGPLYFPANVTVPSPNPYSWTKLAKILYIDQRVGTGYSGGDDQATFNAQVTQDFEVWLKAFYDVFPSLRSKNTYIMGKSYSGIFSLRLRSSSPDTTDFVNYLNLSVVRQANHAPNKSYADCDSTVLDTLSLGYVEPPAYSIMPAILEAGIGIHIYSGDYDFLLNHLGVSQFSLPLLHFESDGLLERVGDWGARVVFWTGREKETWVYMYKEISKMYEIVSVEL